MEIHNYMEDVVSDVLDSLLSDMGDLCKCEQCRRDIMAIALNKLGPKYVVTPKGRVYTKLAELEQQLRTDVIKELTKAIDSVKSRPRH